jgi:hypothetical protein
VRRALGDVKAGAERPDGVHLVAGAFLGQRQRASAEDLIEETDAAVARDGVHRERAAQDEVRGALDAQVDELPRRDALGDAGRPQGQQADAGGDALVGEHRHALE